MIQVEISPTLFWLSRSFPTLGSFSPALRCVSRSAFTAMAISFHLWATSSHPGSTRAWGRMNSKRSSATWKIGTLAQSDRLWETAGEETSGLKGWKRHWTSRILNTSAKSYVFIRMSTSLRTISVLFWRFSCAFSVQRSCVWAFAALTLSCVMSYLHKIAL